MHPLAKTQPISQQERLISIDIIRGIALLGILFVNFPQYTSIYNQAVPAFYTGIDSYLRLFYDLFVQTKFYTIFSFLFGWGFFIFMKRAEQRQDRIYLRFSRRMIVLLLIGLLHEHFWFGDILHDYALLGLGLFLFYRIPAELTARWALFISSLFIGGQVFNLLAVFSDQNNPFPWLGAPEVSILAMFLWGMATGKALIFERVEIWMQFLRKVQLGGLLLTIPGWVGILYLFNQPASILNDYLRYLYVNLTAIPLALCYLATLTKLLTHPNFFKLLRPVGYVGQMALTNYLIQTVIGMSLVQLLHFQDEIPLSSTFLLTWVIFSVQVLISRSWLKKHRYGPLEYLWRSLTYGRLQPNSHRSNA
ncbi:DUF418 domain-containing protein [Rubeoparvulum massiliense]|uniref:DUF418 domain-containing protein n=1 Tax=Rubeoparvulum massiliense TaxID=1631346 RepID=UPI00065DBD33|nr:DUF418 domain-containing protein [Rubeoparvulum massiliense]